ncbi:hypothetical protein ACH79_22260 [Bradyrhizobium sp. CCBAU 051011]|uniref:hypothetical protein n=1 Tax=Bradyrhizobium sp. CCBAU 051011 TaxID=858422 RepID=UPI001373A312|nr:hypothetical protein [Bradyrhizobium sp. CCBAU 051011]QHO74955.1 hypothetical protein ACH79_22260 [Bradyrhizobium sp. CCBAU 051011]
MDGFGVFIIFVVFGGGAFLASIIPGLIVGVPVGMFVHRRDVARLICLTASFIGAIVAYLWLKKTDVAFDPVPLLVFWGALLTTIALGTWIGRKLASAGNRD